MAGCFVLAGWAFSFPLSYCDSPSWAPTYLAKLLGIDSPVSVRERAALVRAWFGLWGTLSIAFDLPNLIGWVQAMALGATALAVGLRVRSGMRCIELLLLPALVLSGLRHAIYSQTLLSEPVVIPVAVGVSLWLIRAGTASLRACAGMSALAVAAASARPEHLLLVGLVLGRIAADRSPLRQRVQRLALALAVAVSVSAVLARLAPAPGGEPVGKVMLIAEWMRFTEPPRNALARLLHFDLVDRMAREMAGASFRNIYDGLDSAQRLFQARDVPDWLEIARFVGYQLANRPFAVLADRARIWTDLHASGYASFWPAYRPVSSFYSPYDQVFARWTPEQLEAARYSCPNFARAQGRHYRVAALRSERAVRVLRGLHEVAEGYARWVLRALHWLALPASFVLILRRRGGAPYVWLTTLIVASHAVRAVSVYADERYQLPVDLLTVAWLMLTLRLALDRAATSARAVGSRPASEG